MATAPRRGFISAGTWCVDINCLLTHWPEEDGIAERLREERQGGGSGCNLALNMKQIDPDMPVSAIALVGDDDPGRFLVNVATQFDIDCRQMHVAPGEATQVADAFVSRESGRRTHLFRRGVASMLNVEHFDFSDSTARYLHLGMPGIHHLLDAPAGDGSNGWVEILRKANRAGLKSNMEMPSLDSSILVPIVRPCLPHLDLLIVNDVEIASLSGKPPAGIAHTDPASCEKAAQIVLELGVRDLVVVHWPEGAVAVARDGEVAHHESVNIPTVEIVSANGAGDAFASGMLYGLHEGWELNRCLKLAHANAACSLRSLSTTGSILNWQESLSLAEAWGWRT
jgi:sugar/nucleoside kinase (ribokinase family)